MSVSWYSSYCNMVAIGTRTACTQFRHLIVLNSVTRRRREEGQLRCLICIRQASAIVLHMHHCLDELDQQLRGGETSENCKNNR